MNGCILCQEPIIFIDKNSYSKLTKKGLESCNNVRILHGQPSLEYDENIIVYVHVSCRKRCVNSKYITNLERKRKENDNLDGCSSSSSSAVNESQPSENVRSKTKTFNAKADCILCGDYIDIVNAKKHPNRANIQFSRVEKLSFCEQLKKKCLERKCPWSNDIMTRINLVFSDFVAEEVAYHRICHRALYNKGNKPDLVGPKLSSPPAKKIKIGKTEDSKKMAALEFAIDYLERNDNETVTIETLHTEMKEKSMLQDSQIYSTKQMLTKLQKHYGERLITLSTRNQTTIVTLTSNLNEILYNTHVNASKKDSSIESIIEDVGDYVRNDIRQKEKDDRDVYPDAAEIKNLERNINYIPSSLKVLLKSIIKSKNSELLVASIGQAIMHAVAPNSFLPPIQLAVAVSLEHKYGSKSLINLLNSLGFCSSYSEADRYRKNAALSQGVEVDANHLNEDTLIQWAADNVDHDSLTLDGRNQIHMMGMMATYTPSIAMPRRIPRRKIIDKNDIIEAGQVRIIGQTDPKTVLKEVKYTKVSYTGQDESYRLLDFLWTICRNPSLHHPQPQWTGFMISLLGSKEHPGKSSELFLPMIDLKPSDPTCVRSTLEYISDQANKMNQEPIITFDQQLWWVAMMVIESQPESSRLRRIVLMLGGFHEEMSALGSVGSVMDGSGIKEVLSTVYAEGSVDAMLSGKAVARAFRGHQLLDTALNILTLSKALNIPIVQQSSMDENNLSVTAYDKSFLSDIQEKIKSIKKEESDLDSVLKCEELKTLERYISTWKKDMKVSSRTAALWIQYQDMIASIRQLVFSARTGNWLLYLNSHHRLLKYLAATGHNNYVKSLSIFLSKMKLLPSSHPKIYEHFLNGKFVIRRGDQFFSGIFGDLHMEQVYMGYIKSPGGLSRGRGFSELTRLTYFMSMPACAEVSKSLHELTGTCRIEKNHKDLTEARISRDNQDIEKILNYLIPRDPFDDIQELRSLSSGITADKTVNCDTAEEVGNKIILNMEGKTISEHTFERKNHIKTLASVQYIQHEGEAVIIDPQILFQRLVIVGERSMDLNDMFSYELCSYPASLFDKHILMRSAQKGDLIRALVDLTSGDCVLKTQDIGPGHAYVLDGGNLLHQIQWKKGSMTYGALTDIYVNFVCHYSSPTVVFDGYPEYSTKDECHLKRKGNKISVPIMIGSEKLVDVNQKSFLDNEINKQRFINLLADSLRLSGVSVFISEADADVQIADVALDKARYKPTVVIANDSDLTVLLLYKFDLETMEDIIVHSKQRILSIKKLKTHLLKESPNLIETLLFVHAISGCDTCSSPLGVGKKGIVSKIPKLVSFASVFMKENEEKENIMLAGEKAMCVLYGIKHHKLDQGRAERYRERIATGTKALEIQNLPPTSNACQQHSFRVYLQVQEWLGKQLPPTDYGWEERMNPNGKKSLRPIRMTKSPAPSELLTIVRCGCTQNICTNNRCSCYKAGLKCTTACRNCKGTMCHNSGLSEQDLNEDEDNS